jgi:hypothetical protein
MDKQLVQMSRILCADLDTPISLGVSLRLKYEEWDQLLVMRIDPSHYIDTSLGARKYLLDSQAIDLLRKFPDIPSSVKKRDIAVDLFWQSEKSCCQTNLRLNRFLNNFGLTDVEVRLFDNFIKPMQNAIQRILGPLPRDLDIRFGPGATFESKGHPFASSLTVADKMTMQPTYTPLASPLLTYIERSAWGRAMVREQNHMHQPVKARGNRFTTVPKDATKDRGICIEPGCNIALQLGIGRLLRSRLKRHGLDLDIGQDIHRAKAREGSSAGVLATCDLSNASDTVSLSLVKLLLPEDWYGLLAMTRSPLSLIDGKWVRLEKFSSMGNGYTFELETLIFAVITMIATKGNLGCDVFAFGDDIIYPSRASADLLAALAYFGFTPNPKKSFSKGPFRESCGGDFFLGFPVRPFFLKKSPRSPSEWIAFANGIRQSMSQISGSKHFRIWKRILNEIPVPVRRCRGPEHLGDLLIHDSEDQWNYSVRNSIRYFRVWRPVLGRVSLSRFPGSVQLAAALYGAADGGRSKTTPVRVLPCGDPSLAKTFAGTAFLTPRGKVSGYRFGRVAYS